MRAQRLVFYSIEPNAFDWDWDNTTDGGASWKRQWRIHYARTTP